MKQNRAIEILKKGYLLNATGKKVKLSSIIDANESKFLFDFIVNNKEIQSVLEIGCGHGISSLTISSALENRIGSTHTIIDPFQEEIFYNLGIQLLEEQNLSNFIFIDMKSSDALPTIDH